MKSLNTSARLLVILASAVPAMPAQAQVAQVSETCGAELRGGIRPAYPHAVEPFERMGVGWALALGASCPVSGALRVGGDVEANMGPNLGVVHFLATGERRIRAFGDGAWTLSGRGGVGWAVTVGSLGSSLLLAQGSGQAFQEEKSGPAVALGGRLQSPLSGSMLLAIDAGVRAALIDETDFDEGDSNRRLLMVFPITIGLGFRL